MLSQTHLIMRTACIVGCVLLFVASAQAAEKGVENAMNGMGIVLEKPPFCPGHDPRTGRVQQSDSAGPSHNDFLAFLLLRPMPSAMYGGSDREACVNKGTPVSPDAYRVLFLNLCFWAGGTPDYSDNVGVHLECKVGSETPLFKLDWPGLHATSRADVMGLVQTYFPDHDSTDVCIRLPDPKSPINLTLTCFKVMAAERYARLMTLGLFGAGDVLWVRPASSSEFPAHVWVDLTKLNPDTQVTTVKPTQFKPLAVANKTVVFALGAQLKTFVKVLEKLNSFMRSVHDKGELDSIEFLREWSDVKSYLEGLEREGDWGQWAREHWQPIFVGFLLENKREKQKDALCQKNIILDYRANPEYNETTSACEIMNSEKLYQNICGDLDVQRVMDLPATALLLCAEEILAHTKQTEPIEARESWWDNACRSMFAFAKSAFSYINLTVLLVVGGVIVSLCVVEEICWCLAEKPKPKERKRVERTKSDRIHPRKGVVIGEGHALPRS